MTALGIVNRMSRHRPPSLPQGTWRSGALHVWGWNGQDTASMAWLYSGFRKVGEDGRRTGWHDSPISYGAIGRITIDVPGHHTMHASSVQLDAIGTAVWLSELPEAEFLSDSLRWFATIAELARRTVATNRIVPSIDNEGPFTVGRWKAVTDDQIDDVLIALDASMPDICVAGSGVQTATIYNLLLRPRR